EVLGRQFRCTTDAGVFSRDGLDMGTRILLEALPPLSGRILDLGCGWGPVGTALGSLYPEAEILLTDVNERAAELARRNLAANGVKNAAVVSGDGYEAVDGQFDSIVLNPPIRAGKNVIYGMFEGALSYLKDGGALYIVIRKQQGAESAERFLQGIYANVERIAREKGYWVLKCRK
ncbi:MAG: class I SAM-dependent methyltransferase, partial [Clostridia bacterium]|nr:class I SAM-dependent methyltransferase [Clostridia bacterium]